MLRPIHRWVVVSIAGTIWALPVTASAPKPDPPANAVLVSAPRDPEVLPTEAEAVAALEKLGAQVSRNEKLPNRPVDFVAFPRKKCDVVDGDLKYLAVFPKLHTLYVLGQKRVTGSGLAHLVGLKDLEVIDLSATPIEGKHIAHLGGLPKLWKLGLWETAADDDGLTHLKNHKSLKNLYLTGTKITDQGLKNLGSLPLLEDLRIGDTLITDEGLRVLTKKTFPVLGGADVGGSKVTLAGAERIGKEQGMVFDFYDTGLGTLPKK
jgi:hypothetical protein